MQKYEETHQFFIGREKGRKKKKAVEKCSNKWIKVQSIGRAAMETTGGVIDAVLESTQSSSEVATSGKLKGI